MKATTIFGLILIMIFPTLADGQATTYYHEDTFDKTFTQCENPPTFGKDSLDLQRYLTDKLQNEISSTQGQIDISLLIDTTGKIQCESITNYSNLNLDKTKLNILFDSMPYWNCGIQNGQNCVELVEMVFKNQRMAVTYRIGRE